MAKLVIHKWVNFSGANINGCDKYQVDMVPLMNCVKYTFCVYSE